MAEKVMTLYFKDNAVNLLMARGKKVDRWVMSRWHQVWSLAV